MKKFADFEESNRLIIVIQIMKMIKSCQDKTGDWIQMSRRCVDFTITIGLVICMAASTRGQSTRIPFYSPDLAENIDYHSFPSMLVLKHSIGKFYKLPKNPVLTLSRDGWDSRDVSDPFVLATADTVYLFYDGSSGGKYHIGYAVRDPDGWNWIRRGKVFGENNGLWDSYHQIDPFLVSLGDEWRLYYSGNSSDSELGYQIGAAVKSGSGDWSYSPDNPVMALDSTSWDNAGNIYSSVVYLPERDIFRMWYTGFQGPLSGIGLAESRDGFHWEKVGSGPVLNLLPGVICPAVIYNGEKYVMYFVHLSLGTRYRTKICRTESQDGIHWGDTEDILLPDEKWEGGKLMKPNLSCFEGRIHLYYCAQKSSSWRIGDAIAEAAFAKKGLWRSRIMKDKISKIEIKYELPTETSMKAFVIDAVSGGRKPLSLDQATPLRANVYSKSINNLSIQGDWQVELELKTTVENLSPVVYEINFE